MKNIVTGRVTLFLLHFEITPVIGSFPLNTSAFNLEKKKKQTGKD